MNNISRVSLEDTLSLIQLMRETALVQGRQVEAQKLEPVVDEMRNLVAVSNHRPQPAPAPNILGQSDFKKLLEISQAGSPAPAAPVSMESVMERNRMVVAMSSASMSDVDIARQLGMTRDEVQMVISTTRMGR